MSSKGSIGQELTWSWAFSTGHPASDQHLEAAAKAVWPYALLCARTYVNDLDAAHNLMDHGVQNAAGYIARHPNSPLNRLTARLKSAIRRRAKQIAAGKKHELSFGSLVDLEHLYAARAEPEQSIYANEFLARLSPLAQSIMKWRWLGYSWREIAMQLEMDHTVVRRAYFRELEALLQSHFGSGDFCRCD
jgi:hypothetical protein